MNIQTSTVTNRQRGDEGPDERREEMMERGCEEEGRVGGREKERERGRKGEGLRLISGPGESLG